MFKAMEVDDGCVVKMWLPEGHIVEDKALNQLCLVARLPFVERVACMPDVHVGKGSTIGSVLATSGAIIPAAVGVDIGCGMMARQLNLHAKQLPDLKELRTAIERRVPHGRTNDGQEGDRGAWKNVPDLVEMVWSRELVESYANLLGKHPKLAHKRALQQLGTLGTGNHFIEICLDEEGRVWIMLHSGSRGPGARIGNYFTKLAQKDCDTHHVRLESKDLAYLSETTPWFDDYVEAVQWAQNYATQNRELMMSATLDALAVLFGWPTVPPELADPDALVINCHHNYVTRENHRGKNLWITRKGAVQAREGTMGIIPGSMGAKSFIVRGKGCKEALNSCSHGAGRIMSRTEAKRTFTVEDLARQTEGVECCKDASVLDEIPECYKDIDAVMAAQTDMVDMVYQLKQIVCVKGHDEKKRRRKGDRTPRD